MGEVLNEMKLLNRNSIFAMFVFVVVVFVAVSVSAQEQALTTLPPSQFPPYPYMDLFTGASHNYPEPIRKVYSDDGHSTYHVSCPKSDKLGSLAAVLGSASKILLALTAIVFLKVISGKLMLFPLTMLLFAKMGLKALLFWPMISKMIKYFKNNKKKGVLPRSIVDCTDRIACVIRRSTQGGWGSNLGAAVTFSLLDDVEEDNSLGKMLLSVFAGDKVARCMTLECTSGIDITR